MGADPKDKMEPHLRGTQGDPGGLQSTEGGGAAAQLCQATWLLRCPHVPAGLLIMAHRPNDKFQIG